MRTLVVLLLLTAPLFSYDFEGHERVLHLHCGDGALTAQIAPQVPDGFVMGFDASQETIEQTKETYDLDLFANLEFQHGDLLDLPFEEEFDVVLLYGATSIPDQMLAGIQKSLRPNGRLIIEDT